MGVSFISKENEVLKFAVEQGIINLAYVREQIEMNKREEILKNHPYEIWEGKNGKWYTYLPDEEKGRVQKKNATRKGIEQVVVDYWKNHSEEEEKRKFTKELNLRKVFPIWLNYKQVHTDSTAYIKRITADWHRFYLNQEQFINMPLSDMTKLFLDEWAHNMIKEKELTKKCYYNMSMILRQCLDFAVENGWIESNVFSQVTINTRLFRRTKKKTGETQVYTVDEEAELINDMHRRFQNRPQNMSPLAVMFLFETGLRIGEVCAVKHSDIEGNYIHIQRQEVRDFEMVDDCTMKFKCFKIVEYAKTDDGFRDVYLTESAKKIIEIAKIISEAYGYHNMDGFIFHTEKGNVNHYSIQAMIKRGCEHLNMMIKTSHKIRKTYISTLIDSGLNIDEIRRMVGHADERTTYGNYCFNRMTNKQTEDAIEGALKKKAAINGNQFSNIVSFPESRIYAVK